MKKLQNNKKVYEYDDDNDNVHTLILKEIKHEINDILCLVCNHWKNIADITPGINTRSLLPLRKYKKSQEGIKGYRPSFMEKVPCKLDQMILNQRIQTYLMNLKILSKHQHAEKNGVGSEDCLIAFTKTIHAQIQTYQPTHVAGFDSSDAYDSQLHLIIYDKFKYNAGFDRKANVMVKSLITGRKSKCIINGTQSELVPTKSGPLRGCHNMVCIYQSVIGHTEKKSIIKNRQHHEIAKIIAFG